ncbi:MAG: winged helix-turn-helix domain-containing protein [Bacteroidota bacterium]
MILSNRSYTINKSITVLPSENKIILGKVETYLEPRIMRLLVLLCSKPREVLLKSTLIEIIWASKHINEEGLTKAISVLRKTLQDPKLIKTVPKQGYSFEGEIELLPTSKRIGIPAFKRHLPVSISLAAILIIVTFFSSILVRKKRINENRSPFEYTYMTYTKGMHLAPAISSTDLIAYVSKNNSNEQFQLVVKSSKSDDVIFQSADEVGDISYPVFSPESNAIAFIAKKSGQTFLKVLNLSNTQIETIYVLGNRSFSHVDWSPDGSLLVFSDRPNDAKHYDLFTYNLRTSEVVQLTDDTYNEFNPVFSSDGSRIAFLQSHPNYSQKSLSVYSMESGAVSALKEIDKQVYDHDWTDQDNGLLFISSDDFGSYIHKLNLSTGDESLISNHNFSQLSAHSNRILACNFGSDNNLWAQSLNANRESKVIANSSRHELLGVLSPDKSRIAYISNRSGSFQLWLYHFENEKSEKLTSLKGRLHFDRVSWSLDGNSILAGIRDEGKTKIVRISVENGQSETLLEDDNLNRFPKYHTMGEVHFISDRSGQRELWSFSTETRKTKKLSHLTQPIDYAEIGEDGMLYFSKSNVNGIWKSTLEGKNETSLTMNNHEDVSNWQMIGSSIYFLNRSTYPPTISELNTSDYKVSKILELSPGNQSEYIRFSVSSDQSSIVYNYSDHFESDIVLLAKK